MTKLPGANLGEYEPPEILCASLRRILPTCGFVIRLRWFAMEAKPPSGRATDSQCESSYRSLHEARRMLDFFYLR